MWVEHSSRNFRSKRVACAVGLAFLFGCSTPSTSGGAGVRRSSRGAGQAKTVGPEADDSANDEPSPAENTSCNSVDPSAPAYLHGNLSLFWSNFRVVCDPQHKAAWVCEQAHGQGASECDPLVSAYEACLASPPSKEGVCRPQSMCSSPCGPSVNGTLYCDYCGDPYTNELCETESFFTEGDYARLGFQYYGYQNSAIPIHMHNTLLVFEGAVGDPSRLQRATAGLGGARPVVALSSHYGSGDANTSGIGSQVGKGSIQRPSNVKSRFGAFACVELPKTGPVSVFGSWFSDFAHIPMGSRFFHLTSAPQAGHHYALTANGIEDLGCAPDLAEMLPGAYTLQQVKSELVQSGQPASCL
jgi:hypothetical protein